MSESKSGERTVRTGQRSITTLAAFLLGVPLALGTLTLLQNDWLGEAGQHYIKHPVEKVEIVLFCCALAALFTKLWLNGGERLALRKEVIPLWDAQAVPASEASALLDRLHRFSR